MVFDDSIDEKNDEDCFDECIDQSKIQSNMANARTFLEGDTSLVGHVNKATNEKVVYQDEEATNVPVGENIGELEIDYENESLDGVDLNSNRDIEDECKRPTYHKYNPIEMNVDFEWKKGIEFNCIY